MKKGYADVIEDAVEHYNNASPPISPGALLPAILDAASHTQTTADEEANLSSLSPGDKRRWEKLAQFELLLQRALAPYGSHTQWTILSVHVHLSSFMQCELKREELRTKSAEIIDGLRTAHFGSDSAVRSLLSNASVPDDNLNELTYTCERVEGAQFMARCQVRARLSVSLCA